MIWGEHCMEDTNPTSDDFSGDELDRVIRRAVELQFEAGSDSKALARIDEREIRRIGAEVGIDDRFLRQAIGEVRAEHLLAEVPDDTGRLARWLGDRHVRTQRVVPGDLDGIERTLDDHLRQVETLSPVRNRRGMSLWQPEEGVGAQIRRALRWGGYRYELAKITSLEVGIVPMEDGFCLVNMVVDLKGPRTEAALGGSLGVGVPATTLTLVFGILAAGPWIGVPAGIAAGATGALLGTRVARGPYRSRRDRVRLALEGILDHLETGEPLQRRSRRSPRLRLPGRR